MAQRSSMAIALVLAVGMSLPGSARASRVAEVLEPAPTLPGASVQAPSNPPADASPPASSSPRTDPAPPSPGGGTSGAAAPSTGSPSASSPEAAPAGAPAPSTATSEAAGPPADLLDPSVSRPADALPGTPTEATEQPASATPPPAAASSTPSPPPPTVSPSDDTPLDGHALVVGGVAAVSLGVVGWVLTAVGLGVANHADASVNASTDAERRDRLEDREAIGKRMAIGAGISAAVLLVAGIPLIVIGRRRAAADLERRREAAVALEASPSGLRLRF